MAHTVATMLSSGKGRAPSLSDFVLRWTKRRRQSSAEQLAIFRALASDSPKDGANGDDS